MSAGPTRLSYRFGPLERRGILGPIRAGQAALLGLGALLAIVTLDQAPTAAGAIAAAGLFASSVVVAVAPLGSRTIEEWGPVAVAFAWRSARGQRRFRSPIPTRGIISRWNAGAGVELAPPTVTLPRALQGLQIVNADYRDRSIGVLSERGGRRLTAVLVCRVVAFSLLDPEAQERRLARWGLVLSNSANTPIRRIQWIERTAPAQGDELARWVHSERDPAIPLRGTPMIESYLELIGATAQVTQEHEILLAVQVDGRRVHDRGADAVTRALIEQTERVAEGLRAAEVTVLGALSSGQLGRVLRTACDPYARAELAALETADPDRDGLAEHNAWPLGAREAWDHYRSDGALHATYWIGGWPRVDVSPMFMDALLGHSSAVRAVAVTFEPIAPERSTREVEAAVRRGREAELAAGHGEVRLAGFVTVSGRDPGELRRGCSEVLEHAARARLELHRMYGEQAEAFAFTLPLCRGLR